MNEENEGEEHKNKDARTISLEKIIAIEQKRTEARKRVKPELKDYLAIVIALLETIFLPLIIIVTILVALSLVFLILIH